MTRFCVTYLKLPGFLARGKADTGSNVNVLTAFDCRAFSACYSRHDIYLPKMLRYAVDADIVSYKNDSNFAWHQAIGNPNHDFVQLPTRHRRPARRRRTGRRPAPLVRIVHARRIHRC